jgi:uncharacterized membrane protein
VTDRALRQVAVRVGWGLLVLLSGYYLYRAVHYRFVVPDRLGPSFFNKQFWYILHMTAALPVVVGEPLQFVSTLRARRPALHRAIGRVYVIGASIAALTAIYLGAIVGEYPESRLPLALLGSVWLFFTLAAWRCAVQRRYLDHRMFMVRSYGLALVLVWLRLMYDAQDWLFFYVTDPTLRDATREWASWIVPLLVMELWLSWWPLLRGPAGRTLSPADA